jgi:hypothetical protein
MTRPHAAVMAKGTLFTEATLSINTHSRGGAVIWAGWSTCDTAGMIAVAGAAATIAREAIAYFLVIYRAVVCSTCPISDMHIAIGDEGIGLVGVVERLAE